MFKKILGPFVAAAILLVIFGLSALLMRQYLFMPYNKVVANFEALGHPIDVGMAICLAYLGLDRFRYKRHVETLIVKLGPLASKTRLVDDLRASNITSDQNNVIQLLILDGDPIVKKNVAECESHLLRSDFWNGMAGRTIRWFVVPQVDRAVMAFLLVVLAVWQITSAYSTLIMVHVGLFNPDLVPGYWWIFFFLTCSFVIPTISVLGNDAAMEALSRSAAIWRTSMEASIQQASAQTAANPVAELPPH